MFTLIKRKCIIVLDTINIIVFLWTNFLWSHEVFVLEFRPGPVAPHPFLKLNISWPQPCSMHPLLIDNNRSNPVSGQLKTVLTNPLWHLYPSSKRLINLSVTVSADCMISYSPPWKTSDYKSLLIHSQWEHGDNNRSERMAVTHETHPNRSIYRDTF